MRHTSGLVLAAMAIAGCSTLSPEADLKTVKPVGQKMEEMPTPTSDAVVSIDLGSLSLQDMRLGDDFMGTADLAVEQRKDADGAYSFIQFTPRPGMSKWITTIIGLPQVDFADGIEWMELEAWNPGVPLRIVVDATDQDADCFEIGFCPNDTVWEGWRTFRVPTVGERFVQGDTDLRRTIKPPVGIKWMIVIMRQGLPWQLGLRDLRVKPLSTAAPLRLK
ncbi:MAG TPA: hypothetical protein VMZ31_06525 [Phycisphaerae bacterium]|nr:hypothetical protein [Phycisphaerae bacterium]